MSSDRDRQLLQARELDRMSTVMINLGIRTVKKNPIKVSFYLLGLLLCLFFNGWAVSDSQRNDYQKTLNSIDHDVIQQKHSQVEILSRRYYDSKGWFSCDIKCQEFKKALDSAKIEYNKFRAEEEKTIAKAKSFMGLFSEYGVSEVTVIRIL